MSTGTPPRKRGLILSTVVSEVASGVNMLKLFTGVLLVAMTLDTITNIRGLSGAEPATIVKVRVRR
jgi:hypothetical protein